jgi:hypothetical protein
MAHTGPGVPNEQLLQAGLKLMDINGKSLTRKQVSGRSMKYSMSNGQTVRVRTCNDHVLIVLASQHEGNAKLNIEGTDWLLVVMPEVPRTPGKVIAYLVPEAEAVREVRATHQAWLDSDPNTKGNNRTWNIWFDPDGPVKANDFARKWSRYRLVGDVSTVPVMDPMPAGSGSLRTEIEDARMRIARVAGVPPGSVTITIGY